jgi:hypothetical protein
MSGTMSKRDYKSEIKDGLCVVEISGESCANCLTLMPVLKELMSKIEGVRWYTSKRTTIRSI